MKLIIGTYGKRLILIELESGSFELLDTSVFPAENTSCLALSPDKRYLFAVSESSGNSGVYSFEILRSDRITKISEVRGIAQDPCHLIYLPGYYNQCGNPENGVLLTADYTSGSISLYPVRGGQITPASQVVRFEGRGLHPERQQSPHIHHLVSFGNLLLAVDLGTDSIHVLRLFDSAVRPLCDGRLNREPRLEKLFDITVPAGSGPRHLVIDKAGSHFYVLTELSNEILVYAMPDFSAPDDRPTLLQQLPAGNPAFPGQAGGDIQLSPDGRHLYASLRNGDDGLVICQVQPDGTLQRIGFQPTGAHVRDFCFLPADAADGEHLAVFCKNSRCIQFHRRNPADGSLTLVREIPFNACDGEPVFGLPLNPAQF